MNHKIIKVISLKSCAARTLAIVAGMLMILLCGHARAASVNTWLYYDGQSNYLNGMTTTESWFGEFDYQVWCIEYGWIDVPYYPGAQAYGCTGAELRTHTPTTYGELHGPGYFWSGWHSGSYASGVGYTVGNPSSGQWNAFGNHQTSEDVHHCSVILDPWSGQYYIDLNICYYVYSFMGIFLAQTSASAIAGCPLDMWAIIKAQSWPFPEPFERAVIVRCSAGGLPNFSYENDSFGVYGTFSHPSYPNLGPFTNDPCKSITPILGSGAGPWGALHTHPYFVNSNEFTEGDGCHGANTWNPPYVPSPFQLAVHNLEGEDWSDDDLEIFSCRNVPAYMRTPTGITVKKIVGTPGAPGPNNICPLSIDMPIFP